MQSLTTASMRDATSKSTMITVDTGDGSEKGRKTIAWSGLVATVPQAGGGRKEVIRNVSGVAEPGEVLALMGGSGAGKTTLMNILAHLDTNGVEYLGDVTVNGKKITKQKMRQMCAYVQQVDLFCGTLTVREQLTYTAHMRMKNATVQQKMERVENVLRDMNLTDCQNTLIGIPNRMKGISIGEKKRLAFACEILTDPKILFCDEPTSGLDAFMASEVVRALLDLANKGKTIIVVLHQPSSTVFRMFHKVCFMATGKTVYHGAVDRLCPFFDKLGPDFRVPESYNPADFVMSEISISPETEQEDVTRIEYLIHEYQNSDIGTQMLKKTRTAVDEFGGYGDDEDDGESRYNSTFGTQFEILLKRSLRTTFRDPLLLRVRFAQILATAILVGIVNWRVELKGPTIQNLEGVMYNCARDMTFLFYFPSVNVITSELPVFLREHKSNIYSVEAYFLAKSLAELPQYTILPMIYGTIIYWMAGLVASVTSFLVFVFVCITLTWVAVSIAYVGACIFGDEGLVVTFMPMFVLPMLVFGGFYVNANSIPVYYQYVSFVSWFKHGFEALEANQWKEIDKISGCDLINPLNATTTGYCPASDGPGILTRRGIDTPLYANVLILFMSFFVYRIIGLVALKIRVRFAK
ncbi:ABC transporter domain-containing protein [Caenorhabditis elegans]|uniref:ABC transporter domain-containing protein n=1 Tax=Caenorhabditis elegans TaxID=6239 RepID=O16574_CAEEL|nr:ABC transporter domain-containing protein [Caenorhabditis elegans]CCD64918.2 ABC transporter domain-containing protein [Caenorhabditis elegans]|eukprot:NP_494495.3 WHiTe (Drosophila) related ABC transporter [Caenorhabditis elegans]